MLNKKILKNTLIISFTLGLTACSSSDGLGAKMATLSNQVDALSYEISELKLKQQTMIDDAKSAKIAAKQAIEDAQKANERIDNIVASYKK